MELALRDETAVERQECANCGARTNLLRCSRCHSVHFCGVKCQKAYWPFHRLHCKRNEFADAMEEADPKFATWMRGHGKLAVLKDDEVDRLERAAQAASGPSRAEVMDSMYGRLEPKPAAPSFSAEELERMFEAAEAAKASARRALPCSKAYAAIDVPEGMGSDAGGYKWRQSQTHVEVFVSLPPGTSRRAVHVSLTSVSLEVSVEERPVLGGTLWREVKADESTWYIQDGILEIVLLKRHRRGNYADGETNATTFWYAVTRNAGTDARLALEHPPPGYYSSHWEGEGAARRGAQPRRRLPGARAEGAQTLVPAC
ncbi:hypothetical protein ACKKBF_B20070 [Auxenochlorella protothecoides x Auxenochlorella symbiontica]